MHTFLLLAGRSTRFWPLREKPLFPVCGKTLLEHQVQRLQEGGCANIILVGSAQNLSEATRLFPNLPTVEQEDLTLGMRGALLSILKQYPDSPCMVVGSNDIVEPHVYRSLLEADGDGAILAYEVQTYFPGGYLSVKDNRVVGIVEKPNPGEEPSNLVNIVAHVHKDPQALAQALAGVHTSSDDGYEQALDSLFSSHHYTPVSYTGRWEAVKYPWHILSVCSMLLSEIQGQHIHPSVEIHPSAEITGNVILEEGVKILANAVIRGPAYIGRHSLVANNALVRDSSIGHDCVIGFSTEVKGSVLQNTVWTHMNYIGDSVIGSNVSFGGGAITGNLRLDEGEISSVVKGQKLQTQRIKFGCIVGDHTRIGIHVGTNPGVKIGSGTFINSHVLVDRDIDDAQFARLKNGVLEISPNTAPLPTQGGREQYKSHIL